MTDGPDHEALPAADLRRRQAEEVEAERSRRTGDGDGSDGTSVEEVGAWTPPAELGAHERPARTLFRILGFLAILVFGYLAFRFSSQVLFTPRLVVRGAVVPEEPVEPDEAVDLGIVARNVRFERGAAFAVVVDRNGREVEGPVVAVPARDTTLVPVEVRFPPGDHVITIILFDAWRQNERIGAVHGLLVRSGVSEVDVTDLVLPERVAEGDTVFGELTAANVGDRPERVTPLLVFVPPGEGPPIEVTSGSSTVEAGDSARIRFAFPSEGVAPGRYFASVRVLGSRGERLGSGIYRRPIVIGGGGS